MSLTEDHKFHESGIPRAMLWRAAGMAAAAVLLLVVALVASLSQTIKDRGERAVLSARMVERGLTRTLESVELTLIGIAQDVRGGQEDSVDFGAIRERIKEALQFAPHIRQIVVIRGGRVLVDSNGREGGMLDLGRIDLSSPSGSGLSLGLRIGGIVHSRFLPTKDQTAEDPVHALLPVAITVIGKGEVEGVTVIAGLNAAYLQSYLDDVPTGAHGGYSFGRLSGDPLIQSGAHHQSSGTLASLAVGGGDERFVELTKWGWPEAAIVERLSARYPVGVVLDVSHDDSVAAWLGQTKVMILVLLAATVMLLLAIVFMMRDTLRRVGLQNQVRLLFRAVEQSSMVVLITDAKGDIDYTNPAMTAMFGFSPEEMIGQNPRILNSGRNPKETYEALWSKINAGESWSGEFLNRTKDDRVICVSSTISAVRDDSGETTHFVGVFSDITDTKAAELERERLLNGLERAHSDLQRFAEISAHHLQEPARRIVSFAQRLRKLAGDGLNDEAQISLNFIEEQSVRLRNLLRDIQLYLAADLYASNGASADAGKAARQVVERMGPRFVELGGEISVGYLPWARIEAHLLADAFSILLGNALQYRRPERPPQVRLWGETNGQVSRYYVVDNGTGIAPEYRERVFRVFERLVIGAGEQNTGIGLAIVRRIVESREGKVWIEETSGGGSTIVMELPVGEDEQ